MKFLSLLNKELREMITATVIFSAAISLAAFVFVGAALSGIIENSVESANRTEVNITDNDETSLSEAVIDFLQSGENGLALTVNVRRNAGEKPKPEGGEPFIFIPKGFEDSVKKGEPANISLVRELKSLNVLAIMSESIPFAAVEAINDYVSDTVIKSGNISDSDFARRPVTPNHVTWHGEKFVNAAPDTMIGLFFAQSIFIPIIVFMIVVLGAQTIAAAIAVEKGDKTLETLLSTPVPRLSILMAKMTAAAIVALGMTAVMSAGAAFLIPTLMKDAAPAVSGAVTAFEAADILGLAYTPAGVTLILLNLLATVIIALTAAMVLGSLASDSKSAQTVVMPLTFLVMIPYFFTIFMDINSLPPIPRTLLYAIPFTSTYASASNAVMGNLTAPALGFSYQLAFLIVLAAVAIKIFASDMLFTARLNFSKKKKYPE
ncbi:MAG: ABC transporter permease [Oscillospiraceae bacterium]|nr:ABC transporter permease [Oscillospiraceae bacterium]